MTVFLPAICLAGGDPSQVEYLEGTVVTIPSGTEGAFDLTDSSKLQFHYSGTSWDVPYESIVSYEWSRPAEGFGEQVTHGADQVGRAVMPMLYKTKFLTIGFQGDGGREQAVFRVPKEMVSAADPVLKNWVKRNSSVPVANLAVDESGTWWGNRYWKTSRNKHLWEKAEESPKPGAEGVEVAAREDE